MRGGDTTTMPRCYMHTIGTTTHDRNRTVASTKWRLNDDSQETLPCLISLVNQLESRSRPLSCHFVVLWEGKALIESTAIASHGPPRPIPAQSYPPHTSGLPWLAWVHPGWPVAAASSGTPVVTGIVGGDGVRDGCTVTGCAQHSPLPVFGTHSFPKPD